MDHHESDTLARFARRFAGIEAVIKDPPPFDRRRAAMFRLARTPRSVAVPIAVVAAVVTVVTLGSLLTRDRSIGPGSDPGTAGETWSPSPATSWLAPSPVPTVMIGEWASRCMDVKLVDCRGASERFLNMLARGHQAVFDQSGGHLTVSPRPVCPPVQEWADGSFCWQVTADGATTSSGEPWCMVIAKRSTDQRYPPYVKVGGPDGVGNAMVAPSRQPPCD
jgi:hypothetical protein